MSRVVVNLCWMVAGSVGGSEEYTTRLLGAVAQQTPPMVDVELVAMAGLKVSYPRLTEMFPTHCAPIGGSVRPLRLAVENAWLPGRCRGADLVHHFGGHVPARHGSPTAVTIHDTQPLDMPANFSKPKQVYMQRMIPHAVRTADLICTPSRWVADRVQERFPKATAEVRVVPSTWGDDPEDDASTAENNLVDRLVDRQVILYPAITHPHKNHRVLLAAVAKLKSSHPSLCLVLTGGAGRAHHSVSNEIDQLGLSDIVIRPGRVSAASLATLFTRAQVLAFPSRYEGFGLPVLEAMRCSTPVVGADATALPEVLAGAGILVDPDNSDEWAQALDAALARGPEIERMVVAGRLRSQHFAPGKAAARLTDAWIEAIR